VTLQTDLLALQRSDTRLDQLRHRRAHLPERAEMQAIDSVLNDLRADLDKLSTRQTDLSRSQSRLEVEVASIEDKRRDTDRKLSAGTVPRELQTLMEEGDSLKRRQRALEDELLEIMELAEPVGAQLTVLEQQQTDLIDRRATAKQRLDAAEAAVVSELTSVEAQRATEATAIPAPTLKEYERLRSGSTASR
jgi:predicted  nucleic acid-binding Zn-ribbon protein